MAKFIVFDGVAFNQDWMLKKTEDEFVAQHSHLKMKEEQLREAYRVITGRPAPVKEGSEPTPAEKTSRRKRSVPPEESE